MKIKIVLCEGNHDIAFLSKILYANDYGSYNKKISEYPYPLNELFNRVFGCETISDKKLGVSADSVFIPTTTMQKNDILVLFHNLNGDSTTDERKQVIEQYHRHTTIAFLNLGSTSFEYLLFYDADELGVDGRLEFIKDNFCNQYNIDKSNIVQASKCNSGNISLGTYVFHDESDADSKGTLEDHLLKLMQSSNEAVFNGSNNYMTTYKLDEGRTKFYYPNTDSYTGKKKFKAKKSLISISGQLQFSGCDNSVIISKSDYITKQDILDDAQCTEIMKLFT